MRIEQLTKMVKKIDGFFRSEPNDEEAIKNIADHINRFWDPRMRSKIVAYVKEGDSGLSDRALAAIGRLNPTSARFRMRIEEDTKQQTDTTETVIGALSGH